MPAAQPPGHLARLFLGGLGSEQLRRALADTANGWQRWTLWGTMGLRDIRKCYRRSVIGPFRITLSLGNRVGALGLLYGTDFKRDMHDCVPHLAAGFILRTLITDGTRVFICAEGLTRQLPAPLSVHVYRLIWGNLIAFAHNAVILVVVALWYGFNPGWTALLALPALILLLLNDFWMVLLLGLLSARFRDIPLVVASVVQVMFFITPDIWKPDMLPGRALILDLNLFYHLIEILRAPLLGQVPTAENWLAVLVVTAVGRSAALWFFSAYRWRLA